MEWLPGTGKKHKTKGRKDTKEEEKEETPRGDNEDDGNGPAVNEEQHTNESSSANGPDKNKLRGIHKAVLPFCLKLQARRR
jgi:hypothetical protein